MQSKHLSCLQPTPRVGRLSRMYDNGHFNDITWDVASMSGSLALLITDL